MTRGIGDGATVSAQVPLPLPPRSEPSPDFSIVAYDPDFYAHRHPTVAETYWIIEVGFASRNFDRVKKVPMYARRGVPEVWLADLVDRRVTVYREPNDLGYGDIHVYLPGERIAARALAHVSFAVDELLG